MNELQITEYKNIRVLTTQQIAEAYGTDNKTISYNFNHNKDRYVEGKHFICLSGDELRAFREIHDLPNNLNKLYLWTEKGAFLHAKSLNTDTAWEVYDRLVDNYFEKPKTVPMTTDQKIQLLAQGNVELTEKIDKVDKDLQDFKADMPLLALECQKITRAKNQKVVPLMGGKNAPAYKNKSLMHKVYGDVDAQLRREFGVNTYKAIKRSQCDLAIEIIKAYELPMYLKEEISAENAQMSFAV
nr:ORF6C domain-containing protein [uncultured Mediterraneibacter sp.]